jgi:hypothetical protein
LPAQGLGYRRMNLERYAQAIGAPELLTNAAWMAATLDGLVNETGRRFRSQIHAPCYRPPAIMLYCASAACLMALDTSRRSIA